MMYDGWREDIYDSYYNDDDDCCSEDSEDSIKKYIVNYTETLSRSVIVEAANENDARNKVWYAVDSGQIVLTADDFLIGSGDIGWVEESCGEDEDCYQAI